MNQLNQIIIEGNLCRNPETKEIPGGKRLALFAIATNRYIRKGDGSFEQDTYYFDAEAWGDLAEAVSGKGRKGRGCRIVGRLRQDRWKDSTGKTRSNVRITAEHIDFMPERSGAEENARPARLDRARVFHGQVDEPPETPGFDIF